jgi:hypothetical protein
MMPGMSSSPPPMPVLPVVQSYQSFPQSPQRPGVVTTLGVIGIILSVLSVITSFVVTSFAVSAMLTIQFQRNNGPVGDALRYPLTPDASAIASPDGLDPQKAGFVVEALNRTRPLTSIRASHIRSLSELHGQKLFPFGAEGMTVLRMKANISESGPLMAGVGKSGDYFVTDSGRIEVTDHSAIFRPDTGPTLRSGDVTVDRSLPEPQIDAAIARIESLGPLQLNPAQVATLRRLLRDPGQSIITRADDSAATIANLIAAGAMKDEGVWFKTDKSQVRITRSGTETLLNTLAPMPGTNPATGRPAQRIWADMVIVFQVVSIGLAITMLAWSIGLLRGKPSARRLAMIWALIKLPVVIIGSVMLGLMVAEWFGMISGTSATGLSVGEWGWGVGLASGLIGVAWPVVVLGMINRPAVKEWVGLTR